MKERTLLYCFIVGLSRAKQKEIGFLFFLHLNFEIQSTFMRINPLTILLLGQTALCGAMVLFRNLYSGSLPAGFAQFASLENWGTQTFFFLAWNLLLAWVPYWLAGVLPAVRGVLPGAGLLLLWLLFFPNAPYLITDLIHLRARGPIPLWFDALMLFSAAWTGLLLGYCSLLRVGEALRQRWGARVEWGFSMVALLLCGFGVYLGRFLRWNSWDALVQPAGLLKSIIRAMGDSHSLVLSLSVTILFGALLGLGYFTIYFLAKSKLS